MRVGDLHQRAGRAPEPRDAREVVERMLVAGLQRFREAVVGVDDVPLGIGEVGVGFTALERADR